MLSIFSSAGIKTGIKADSYFLGKIRNKCYFTSLQSEIIELTTTCLLVVIFEGDVNYKQTNQKYLCYRTLYVVIWFFFLIADDEQSKMESSSSSFDNYYPEIAKVIYIMNDYSGYRVLNIILSCVDFQ